jgi:uncharacterized protein (DUF952 family)/quercetin dioxygenase-like cupin family protein
MIIQAATITPFDWAGLTIRDMTAGASTRSSLARITVPPGAQHMPAWSKLSDKFYYMLVGQLHFWLDGQAHVLGAGDLVVVTMGRKFAYINKTNAPADLLLLHTPAFDLDAEVMEGPIFPEPMIYHVTTAEAWAAALPAGVYQPAAFAADGFIHLCEADQLPHVGNDYYRGQSGLVALCVKPGAVQAIIKYEDLTGSGMVFPHVYGALNVDAVQQVVNFRPGPDGLFDIPPEIERQATIQ